VKQDDPLLNTILAWDKVGDGLDEGCNYVDESGTAVVSLLLLPFCGNKEVVTLICKACQLRSVQT